uniref:DNA mismatch repair protein MSH2 n=1 Tax=Guillardia theta TaxID=55529 RepID=A0A7S4JHN4_GUITH
MSVLKHIGKNNELPAVAVSPSNFNSFVVQLLTERQYRVEVWADVKGGKNGWTIIRQGSPGNLEEFEEIVFDTCGETQETPTVVCVQIVSDGAGWRVGLAYCDNTLKIIGVCEFLDGDQLTNLEAALVRLGTKECVAAEDKMRSPVEGKKLREIFDRCDVVLTERKSRDFSTKDINQDLNRLLGPESCKLINMEDENALSSAACLIRYLDLLSDESLHGKFKLQELKLDRYMKLDKAAVRALNLLPQAQDGNRNMSVYTLLNKCKTHIGSRLLLRWIKQPLLDPQEIETRLDLVETFVNDVQLRQSMQEIYLRHVPDLARLARKFQKQSKATLMDAWRLYQFVQQIPSMRQALEDCETSKGSLMKEKMVDPLKSLEDDFKQYERLVEQSLDLEGIDNHEYRINPNYSPDLQRLAERKEELRRDIESERKKAANKLGLGEEKVKLERNKDKIYIFRITRKDEKVLRGKCGSFSVLETRKDGVKFTSTGLRPLSERYKEADDSYSEIQTSLVEKVVEVISTYAPAVESLSEVIAEIDVLVSLAHVASNAPTQYVRPLLSPAGQGDLILKESRHPCVEVMDDVSFIPNDIELLRSSSRLQIITGPNMGGKSTYIRQAGVIVLMAQIGSFVPCSSAEISICHSIHARIGAGDNQLKGVSTFMQEMLDTSSILSSATDKSLIIIDELGRGTSTYDGFGLAWAIAEHIASSIRAPCLFATHFHELTELEGKAEAVTNRHVTAHVADGKLTMLYQVRKGACDQSFGIHVAELAKFPEHVVEMARQKAEQLEMFGNASSSNEDAVGEPASKKRKTDEAAGEQGDHEEGSRLILQFLKDFSALPFDSLAPSEACLRVRQMRDEMASKGNKFVESLLLQPA